MIVSAEVSLRIELRVSDYDGLGAVVNEIITEIKKVHAVKTVEPNTDVKWNYD